MNNLKNNIKISLINLKRLYKSNIKFNVICLVFLLPFLSAYATEITIEVVTFLEDKEQLINSPYELHITNTEDAMINSTVSLEHPDAWLFFDNIKPSDVVRDYLKYVKINGEGFVNGNNGRVAIYGHGTVLMPHGADFKPLTVFTEENFEGESQNYEIHSYHNALGDFDRNIRSFILKRGYQATFATNSDGSGYSRVFIADNKDLEFEVMPDLLSGTVSFIRIFKHQWVSKKGWAGWNANEIGMSNSTWYYDWNIGGNTNVNTEYVAIRQKGDWPSWSSINNKQNISHLMGFNEPDRPDQANMSFDDALRQWPNFMHSGLRLGSPATSDAFNQWSLFNFIDQCDARNYRVDFVVVHCYWGGKSPQNWYNDLKYIHERTGRPIWIKEWNNGANWTNEYWPPSMEEKLEKQLKELKAIINVLDTASFIERYSIYNWVEDHRAVILNGEYTPAGEFYAANPSRIAYNSANEVIPTWTFKKPHLEGRHLTLSNMINLSWDDANGGLSQGYIVEKKSGDGKFNVIFETDDSKIKSFSDPVDPNVSGVSVYRVGLKTLYGDYEYSNEFSIYQTGGSENIQIGKFPVGNSDWSRALFPIRYSEIPMIILGAPSFSNVVAYSTRVHSPSVNYFNFRLHPWRYITNPNFNYNDIIASIAMLPGNYDFEGLKAETALLTNINEEWSTVEFNEEFDTLPVVFCTQVSNNNGFPTVVGIRNVTKTGFEVRLIKEQAVEGRVFNENINYFAITTGNGLIDGKRISVGRSEEGAGIASQTIKVNFDQSYIDPVFFASLQTLNNEFGSVLRFFNPSNGEITFLRQREMSGPLVPINKDDFAWMIIDIDKDQPVNLQAIDYQNL